MSKEDLTFYGVFAADLDGPERLAGAFVDESDARRRAAELARTGRVVEVRKMNFARGSDPAEHAPEYN
jgi:uncharacterized protein YcaQ